MPRGIKRQKTFVVPEAEAQEMIKNAMEAGWLLWVKCSAWGNRKALAKELLEEKFQEDAGAISASKRLLNSEAVERVTSPMGIAQAKARALSRPWFHDGIYYVEERDREFLDNFFKECYEVSKENLDWLIDNYERLKDEYREANPRLYDHDNYPSPWDLRDRFRMSWGWQKITLPMGTDEISVVGKEVVERENRKFQEMMKENAEVTIQLARKSFLEILTYLRNCLKDPGKTFQESTVEKPKEFLKKFAESFNPYKDKPFESLAGDIGEILNGVYAEDLRSDDIYRQEIGKALDDVVDAFESMPVVKLERALDL